MSRTGTEMNGFVNFLKPAGMSSHDAVDFFRRLSGVRRVGHTGTLDPMAVGVLPLCVGKATRIAEYLASDRKRYRCEMQLGITTDTQDVWGRVISKAEDGFAARLCEPLLKETAARFTGVQLQTPPAYSAVKIAGKKLYEYARSGEAVAAPARRTEIFSLEIKRSDLARGLVNFEAECSKGTYMRTLCHDMGQMLGCGAAMSGLIRLDSGMFAIDDAYTVEALEAAFSPDSAPEGVLTAMDAPLREFPSVELSASASRAFVNGARVGLSPREAAGAGGAGSRALCRVYGEAGAGGIGGTAVFLGMGRLEADALVADKVFCQL